MARGGPRGADAPLHVLSELLSGIQHHPGGPDDVTFSLDEIETTGKNEVSTKLVLPSGDVYRVTVAWLSEESP